MAWEDFSLDKIAHNLVYEYRNDDKETVNQVHKMRTTVAYGLERFWGEHQRLNGRKSAYWKDTWNKLVEIMGQAEITVPNNAQDLWDSEVFPPKYRKVTLAILTQLCDSMVWWTQRYKPTRNNATEDDN
ncbi:hypothetical protein [Trichormus variabilis]|uniref:CRISPR type III-B/RAMP module-associated protein Cmr5 n=1 Tax=Trichormus variabilis SAG 1403-4b TaxID=447716 RepID=A0A433UNN9_ANAVA|nr:hypothetical protein [Trichormus variabilis]MBD2626968.1 hypothetical protein [Trichormus variabilis FACHB-164]RUS95473.1 hypothetical protein DSM107003_31760 [Trichormus variabilis SAG 1403-4b]